MSKICAVFTCNANYVNKFISTCNQLLTNGKYKGDVCLIIGDDLKNNQQLLNHDFIVRNKIIVNYFPNLVFPNKFIEINNKVVFDGRNITKKFQWHKMHLFNVFFKQWDYIFYIDCGMNIFSDVTPILNERKANKIVAHSDAYPTYEWKLDHQFCKHNRELFDKLANTYDLTVDYFQTTMLLYDTAVIEEDTYDNLYNLMLEYPNSKMNEQSIMALYFTNIKPCFEQLKIRNETTHFYDFFRRNPSDSYIMIKYT